MLKPTLRDHELLMECSNLNAVVPNSDKQILRDVSFDLHDGEFLTIFGASGSGKTSLLQALSQFGGLEYGGKVTLKEAEKPDIDVLNYARRGEAQSLEILRKVALVLQKPTGLPHLSIEDNVAEAITVNGLASEGSRELKERIEIALRQAKLWDVVSDRLSDPISSISGGQLQRLCLAITLAMEPTVLMLDESTSALDRPLRSQLHQDLLAMLRDANTSIKAIVMNGHNVDEIQNYSDTAMFMKDGEIIEIGAAQQVMLNPQQFETRNFLQQPDRVADPTNFYDTGTKVAAQ